MALKIKSYLGKKREDRVSAGEHLLRPKAIIPFHKKIKRRRDL